VSISPVDYFDGTGDGKKSTLRKGNRRKCAGRYVVSILPLSPPRDRRRGDRRGRKKRERISSFDALLY